MGSNERIPGYVVRDAVCYASAMDPLHTTIEEFAATAIHTSTAIALDAA